MLTDELGVTQDSRQSAVTAEGTERGRHFQCYWRSPYGFLGMSTAMSEQSIASDVGVGQFSELARVCGSLAVGLLGGSW